MTKKYDAEQAVLDTLLQVVPMPTAKFLVSALKEQWGKEEVESGAAKAACGHDNWRFVTTPDKYYSRCDSCGEVW